MRPSLWLVGLITLCAGPLGADDDHDRARRWVEEGRVVPLAQILDAARRRYSGRLLEAKLKHDDERYYYELEIVDSAGVVWELTYDAVNGELLEAEEDD